MAKLTQAQKQVVELIKSDIIQIPSSRESLISLLEQFAAYSDSANDSQAEPEKDIEYIKAWIIKRLTVNSRDSLGGWRYKNTIKGQVMRTKFYQKIQSEYSREGLDAFEVALEMLAGKVEVSSDGKQLKLSRG